jgi:hypothetical protein
MAASHSSAFIKNFGWLPRMNGSNQSRHRRRSSLTFYSCWLASGIRHRVVPNLAPLLSEHSINYEHFRMSKKESINLAKLVRDERQKWQDGHLLAPGAFRDLQKLSDEAFHSLRGKYYRPADLVAEMRLRRRLGVKVPRKTGHAHKIDVSPSEACEHQ